MNIKNLDILKTIKRAIRFDITLYSEVEEKEEYNNQAILIVVLACLLTAISIEGLDIFGIIGSLILELIACAFWIAVIVVITFKALEVRIIPINFARSIGISLFPLLFMFLFAVPYIGSYLAIISIILAIISVFFVVKEQTELETGLSLVLSMIGSIPFIVLNFYLTYQISN